MRCGDRLIRKRIIRNKNKPPIRLCRKATKEKGKKNQNTLFPIYFFTSLAPLITFSFKASLYASMRFNTLGLLAPII